MQSHLGTAFPIRKSRGHVTSILGVVRTKRAFSTKYITKLWSSLLHDFVDAKTINGFKTTLKE